MAKKVHSGAKIGKTLQETKAMTAPLRDPLGLTLTTLSLSPNTHTIQSLGSHKGRQPVHICSCEKAPFLKIQQHVTQD